MSRVFRAKFVAALRKAFAGLDAAFYQSLFEKPWVVYAKRPFLGPKQVIEYLGRYTHKVALSNHRLLAVEKDQVTFAYKDYRQSGLKKQMRLEPMEFILELQRFTGGFFRQPFFPVQDKAGIARDCGCLVQNAFFSGCTSPQCIRK